MSNFDNRDDINVIFSMLDSIREENNLTSLDDVRQRVSRGSNPDNLVNLQRTAVSPSKVIRKPELPRIIENYDTRLDCFLIILQSVNYGETNSEEYMTGHRNALERYYTYAQSNPRDLSVVEGRLKDELSSYTTATRFTLNEKGYYDGLIYVQKALKKSKELIMDRIYVLLKKELG